MIWGTQYHPTQIIYSNFIDSSNDCECSPFNDINDDRS